MYYSKLFGPTDGVADTKTQIGSTYNMRPNGPFGITEARIAYAGVVDAKAASGILHVEVAGTNGPFEYAFGQGAGGAATSTQGPAEIIQMAIPANSGAEIKVYATMAENCKDLTVSLGFESGNKNHVRSYVSTVADATADTELSKALPAVVQSGSIVQIRAAAGNVVNGKAAAAKLIMAVGGQDGPFEWAIWNGSGGATNAGNAPADVINCNIPIVANTICYAKITAAEGTKDTVVSIAVK